MDKPTIYAVDMSDEMQLCAVDAAREALAAVQQKQGVSPCSAIAAHIRGVFDKQYLPGWSCVVGRCFGAYVTHGIQEFCYFSVGSGLSVLIWRAKAGA